MDENNKAVALPCDECSRENQQELLARIDALAREYRGREGALIQVLHMAQGIYGYPPPEVQRVIADGLELPLAGVSGVVSFYFSFPPGAGAGIPSARAWARRVTCAGASASWSGSGSCSGPRQGIPWRMACSRWR